jgi:hypothetical protein
VPASAARRWGWLVTGAAVVAARTATGISKDGCCHTKRKQDGQDHPKQFPLHDAQPPHTVYLYTTDIDADFGLRVWARTQWLVTDPVWSQDAVSYSTALGAIPYYGAEWEKRLALVYQERQ